LTFATVRHRTKVTKGPGSKAAGIAMAVKLIDAAQERWRAINAPHLVALVRAGARFECGKLVERDPVLEAPKPPTTPLFSRPPPRINPSTTQRNNLHPQVLTIAPATQQRKIMPHKSPGATSSSE
jgi:hypothetical protein